MIWNEECYHLAFERFIQLAIVWKLDSITPSLQQQTIKIDYTLKAIFGGKKYATHIISSLVSSCFCFFCSDVQAWMFPRGSPSTLRPGWCNKYLTLREQYYTFAALHKWMNSFAKHLWKKNPLHIAYEKGLMNNHICNLFLIFQEYLFKQIPAYKVVQE